VCDEDGLLCLDNANARSSLPAIDTPVFDLGDNVSLTGNMNALGVGLVDCARLCVQNGDEILELVGRDLGYVVAVSHLSAPITRDVVACIGLAGMATCKPWLVCIDKTGA
jgi:hypothetical protein